MNPPKVIRPIVGRWIPLEWTIPFANQPVKSAADQEARLHKFFVRAKPIVTQS
jgi:hypothetical protein